MNPPITASRLVAGLFASCRSKWRTGRLNRKHDDSRRRGNGIIEFTFLVPWYVFLFVGVFDCGFTLYSMLATQSAARAAAIYCASSATAAVDAATACTYALDQLRGMPNVGTTLTTCSASPLTVTATLLNNTSSPSSADGNNATNVTVTFVTPQLIAIPGIFPGQLSITRTVQMRVGV